MSKPTGIFPRLLDRIERTGNRLPDPLTLFVILAGVVLLASFVLSMIGVSVQHPVDGRLIEVQNLLSKHGIRRIFTDMVGNFTAFPPLGLVLVTMLGIGVAERSGLIGTALKSFAFWVPKSFLSMALVFAGIMSSMAADAGYVVLTPLGAVLFAGMGRHPIAGLAAAFAGVSGGFSANLLLTSLDPLLSGLSTSAAQIIDPNYVVQPTGNYYFMIVSVFMITLVGAFVTDKIVEPRLAPWKAAPSETAPHDNVVAPRERRGLIWGIAVFVASLVLLLALSLPQDSVFRDPETGFAPLFSSLVPILMMIFLLSGLAFGKASGSIRSDKDVAAMTSDTMSTMGGYIVLAFVAAQFVAYFSWSNIGLATAVYGANTLQGIGFTGIPLILAFLLVSAVLNLFIGSASAKWALMGPVFIPMLMMMGYSPELVQATYRVGDSVTNIITPLLPYFPIVITFALKYDPKAGIGTLISTMLPYSIAFTLAWALLLIVWILFDIPLGPLAPLTIQVGV
jgi:aminobenzoyl-glutamate transport protein